jgi:hypothetical protein
VAYDDNPQTQEFFTGWATDAPKSMKHHRTCPDLNRNKERVRL